MGPPSCSFAVPRQQRSGRMYMRAAVSRLGHHALLLFQHAVGEASQLRAVQQGLFVGGKTPSKASLVPKAPPRAAIRQARHSNEPQAMGLPAHAMQTPPPIRHHRHMPIIAGPYISPGASFDTRKAKPLQDKRTMGVRLRWVQQHRAGNAKHAMTLNHDHTDVAGQEGHELHVAPVCSFEGVARK